MKKWIALILTLACIMSLTACSDAAESTESKKVTATQLSQTGTEPSGTHSNHLVTVYLITSVTRNDRDSASQTEYTYDEKGNLIRITKRVQDEDGDYKSITEYQYDTNGNVTKISEGSQSEGYDPYFKNITQYQYDKEGNVVDYTVTSGSNIEHRTFQYDDDQNMILETRDFSYDGGETIKWHFEDAHTYDEKGNHIDFYETRNGEPWVQYTYTYDESNRMIEEQYFMLSNSSEVDYRSTYEYSENTVIERNYRGYQSLDYVVVKTLDEKGNVIKREVYHGEKAYDLDASEPNTINAWVYDEEGRVLEYTEYKNGEQESYGAWIYGANGERFPLKSGSKVYEYTYDENGNITEGIINQNGSANYSCSYTYTAIRVTQEWADRLKSHMAKESFWVLWNMKTYEGSIEEYLPIMPAATWFG